MTRAARGVRSGFFIASSGLDRLSPDILTPMTAESFWGDAETRIRTFPLMLHVVPGGGAHHFEAAVGVLPGHRGRDPDVGESGTFVSLIALIGYRYEPPGRRSCSGRE
jgi:hypothetical protein